MRTFPELPGVELRAGIDVSRPWTTYSERFGICTLDRVPPFRGVYQWRYRRRTYAAGGSSTMVSEPEEPHVTTLLTAPASYHLLLVEPAAIAGALAPDGDPEPARLRLCGVHLQDPAVYRRLQALWAVLDGEADPLEREHRLRRSLERLFEQGAGPGSPPASGCERAIRRARDFIEAHHARRLTLEQVAGAAGLSKFYLERSFGEKLGLPVWEFVRHVRVRRAKERLARGQRPADVAHLVGFSDQAHMTRVFRELYGFTPGQYRRAYRIAAGLR